VGSKEGAVDAAEALCRGEGGAGTYRICRRDKVHDKTRHKECDQTPVVHVTQSTVLDGVMCDYAAKSTESACTTAPLA